MNLYMKYRITPTITTIKTAKMCCDKKLKIDWIKPKILSIKLVKLLLLFNTNFVIK